MGNQKEFEQACDQILGLIGTAKGQWPDIAYYVYKVIVTVPGREPDLVKFVFETFEQIESSEEDLVDKIFTEEEIDDYENIYGKNIDGMLEALLKKGFSHEEFYQKLWKGIQENPILQGEKEKAFAFFYVWIDVKMPYFELEPGLAMSNNEYINIKKEIAEEIKRVRFVLNVPTKQRTEQASRLVKMLEQLQDERQKAVLMAQILNLHRHLCNNDLFFKLSEDGMLIDQR